jgi:hypothetical protein
MRSLALFALTMMFGCDGLFSSFQRSHPQNCVENPLICGAAERCNQAAEVCEPIDPANPDPTMKFFAAQVMAGDGPFSLALADLNNDGKLDVAVACNGSNTNAPGVRALLGDGMGGLAAPSQTPAGSDPVSVIAADLDQDMRLDLAMVSLSDQGRGSLRVLAGDGTGRFTSCANLGNIRRDGPHMLAAADAFANEAPAPCHTPSLPNSDRQFARNVAPRSERPREPRT